MARRRVATRRTSSPLRCAPRRHLRRRWWWAVVMVRKKQVNLLDDDEYIARYLDVAKQKIAEGNKEALLRAMHECLIMKKPLPEWLQLAFIQAYQSAHPFEINSWDEIFGPPHPKGAHLKTRNKHFELSFDIWSRVQELAASGAKIDKSLFEKIGREFAVSGTTAGTIYYDERTQLRYRVLKPANRKNSKKS